jgi:probable phosphoglycerate mutase
MTAKPGVAARHEAEIRGKDRAQVTLLRHGEPDWTPQGGPMVDDPGLTPFGREQAEATAKALASERIDAIYVSPYRRARETAAPLGAAAGITPVSVDDLAEIGVAFEGLTQEEVDRAFVEAAQRPLEEHWEGWPGGEHFSDFHARVTRGIADVLARHGIRPEKRRDFTVWHVGDETPNIVIVAHGGANAVLLTHLLDVRPLPWEWLRFESALAAYSVAQARPLGGQGHVWSLQNFNELDHLRAAGLL